MEILSLRNSLAGAALAAFVGWTAACGFGGDLVAPGELENHVVVHSVLVAGADTVMVVLTRTSHSPGPYGSPQAEPLYGAAVRIASGEETLHLVEPDREEGRCVPRSSHPQYRRKVGCYVAALPGGVRAGATYELEIDLPGRDRIRGRATVPGAPTLLAPAAAATISAEPNWQEKLDPVPVRWGAIEPGHRLELTLRPRDESCMISIEMGQHLFHWYFGVDLSGLDSTSIRRLAIHCSDQVLAESYAADLSLTLFDTAYANYLKENDTYLATPRDRASAGVVGALGVFAGAATTTIPVTLQILQGTSGALP